MEATKTIVVFGDGETWADAEDCHLQEVSVRQHRRLTQEGYFPKNLRCKQESLSARLRGEKVKNPCTVLSAHEVAIADLRKKIWEAGDRHDWKECDRLDAELDKLRNER